MAIQAFAGSGNNMPVYETRHGWFYNLLIVIVSFITSAFYFFWRPSRSDVNKVPSYQAPSVQAPKSFPRGKKLDWDRVRRFEGINTFKSYDFDLLDQHTRSAKFGLGPSGSEETRTKENRSAAPLETRTKKNLRNFGAYKGLTHIFPESGGGVEYAMCMKSSPLTCLIPPLTQTGRKELKSLCRCYACSPIPEIHEKRLDCSTNKKSNRRPGVKRDENVPIGRNTTESMDHFYGQFHSNPWRDVKREENVLIGRITTESTDQFYGHFRSNRWRRDPERARRRLRQALDHLQWDIFHPPSQRSFPYQSSYFFSQRSFPLEQTSSQLSDEPDFMDFKYYSDDIEVKT